MSMKKKEIAKGAEAELYSIKFFELESIAKVRIRKKYRHKKLDNNLRSKRTRLEATLISKAKEVCRTPTIYNIDLHKGEIIMEKIEGKLLRDVTNKERIKLLKKLAKIIANLHKMGIIHGDLTTANIILEQKSNNLAIIDFGLGFFSERMEDRATDLLNLKKTLKALHSEEEWQIFIENYENYANKKISGKIEDIEKRARYVWR